MHPTSYKWKNRLLLVFAGSPSDETYREQLRLLEGSEPGFEDRALLLGRFFDGKAGELGGNRVSVEAAARLRDGFRVEPGGFTVLLVGKDGGEKFRAGEPVSTEEIFRRIDAMPMRRREMGENS